MRDKLFRKGLVVGIIILFIGASVIPSISGTISKINCPEVDKKILNNGISSSEQIPSSSLSVHTFDKTGEKQCNVVLPTDAANDVYDMLEELKHRIVYEPRSDETKVLKNEFVEMLDIYGLIPKGLSKSDVFSLLNPSWLNNKQKTTMTRARVPILRGFMSRILRNIVNLQQIFKNRFGKTVLKNFDKNTMLLPSYTDTATATFCSISSGGNGAILPLFLLPRPRAAAAWSASLGMTLVGELLTGKGFTADGAQNGTLLGFIGMGITYAFPGYITYGFVGYALYTKVNAENIEFFEPPNNVPVISDESPASGTSDVPITISELSFRISDPDGDRMDYKVTTDPNIGSGSGYNKKDGVYTVPISGLEYDKAYRWTVEVDDDKDTIVKEFSFFTEMLPFDPFDNGWQYRKKVTIDHTLVDGSLTDFSVLIITIDSDLRDKAQINGEDILFMDDKGVANKLYHEIEIYDGSSGELVAWVKIPSLSSVVDTVLYMYYGNPSSSSQQYPEKVWDSSYCGVWHLEGFYDSTINDNDGTNYGTDDCSGKIGNAKDFVENDQDYIDLGDMPEPADNHIATGTFEAWINPREGARGSIISKSDNNLEPDRRSYTFYLASTGKFQFGAGSGTWYPDERIIYAQTDDAYVSSGTWQYIVAVADLPSENIILYYNGEEKDSTINTLGNPPTYFYDIVLNEWLGVNRAESGLHYYDGSMDEIRISKDYRSAEWISTQYNNQNNPSSFLSFGSEESGP